MCKITICKKVAYYIPPGFLTFTRDVASSKPGGTQIIY